MNGYKKLKSYPIIGPFKRVFGAIQPFIPPRGLSVQFNYIMLAANN